MPIHDIETLKRAHLDFRRNTMANFIVDVRRTRAEQIRAMTSDPETLPDIETYEREIWRIESRTYLRSRHIELRIFFNYGQTQLHNAMVEHHLTLRELREALHNGDLELQGNYTFGQTTAIFAPQLKEQHTRFDLVKQAFHHLNDTTLTPRQKVEQVLNTKGFGDNNATGLGMIFHPEAIGIVNGATRAYLHKMGHTAASTQSWQQLQDVLFSLHKLLKTRDFIELDWFLYLYSAQLTQQQNTSEAALVYETSSENENHYDLLALYLRERPRTEKEVALTFREVETIIRGQLPSSARQHRSWWANDSIVNVQSQQWLDASWRVSRINMSEEKIIFSRITKRERQYIDFFSELLQALQEKHLPYHRLPSPDGRNWILWRWIPDKGAPVTSLVFSFTHSHSFRVELYIDTRDKERNKLIFDALYERREDIKEELGELAEALEWERMNDNQASRIALYHAGEITDTKSNLTALREWAAEAMSHFQPVMIKFLDPIL
ncbi:DUF4268 domain-containing protein [Ktedonobacter racemifer]|uniref:Uncharacterized protein n=1 Tax=Ktedonobacter racemifer DSM 44963 TaxID=485913 RepID=D6TX18_KTERA|nr:DUF4268 domain-containing protein [Ktedonobacter racemifer]EFH84751.1 hypothetical protein Krac_5855 [Ktedonobacter racemifer DSM 44963]